MNEDEPSLNHAVVNMKPYMSQHVDFENRNAYSSSTHSIEGIKSCIN